MCGIVGAIAKRDVVPILMDGLKRLEYRGYDSAGLAVQDGNRLRRVRAIGKVAVLEELLTTKKLQSELGIAHTRWATHGMPAERNAHPHVSGEKVAVVHNGIIENHASLRVELETQGYVFNSDTDTEVIAHLLASFLDQGLDLLDAVRQVTPRLNGAYALAVLSSQEPKRLIAARLGSPLVIGVGTGEQFLASDIFALLPVTQNFIFLEDGDIAELNYDRVRILNKDGEIVERKLHRSQLTATATDKGQYDHYMLKEIFEQPSAITETLEGRAHNGRLLEENFGYKAKELLDQTQHVHIVACGTSYHAGLVARYWLEEVGVQCTVEVASEFRYRHAVVPQNSLFLTISQSGETADTLAALQGAKQQGYIGSLTICNVAESSLVRGSDVALMTRAGPEIGVASTKAFTTQLVALRLITLALAKRKGMTSQQEKTLVEELHALPRQVEVALQLHEAITKLAAKFFSKQHALFLGRGCFYPIALEGALKLKEISYIHAEAYPAGELKHGPLALIDASMPVICALPNDKLLDKILSNLQEVRARGGELFLFSDKQVDIALDSYHNLTLADIHPSTAPIVYSIPLQLLAYAVAVLKGTDVDKPRNLAKSVTVE
ncbi:glucosamine--fructose-6-phosphate aminotransferase [Achromatium sp. WMS1]|nr:glucosamine--fructose-6-phosphate aminotransferase [Achromatium sp. WMS1]